LEGWAWLLIPAQVGHPFRNEVGHLTVVWQNVRMPDEHPFTLRQADLARADFAAIADDLDFLKAQLARIPTRKELARTALGIIFSATMLTTLAVLWFTGYWRYCLW
jgi:hypothetical protein